MIMIAISISAHYDGTQILLDEPYQLAKNARLLVTILADDPDERES